MLVLISHFLNEQRNIRFLIHASKNITYISSTTIYKKKKEKGEKYYQDSHQKPVSLTFSPFHYYHSSLQSSASTLTSISVLIASYEVTIRRTSAIQVACIRIIATIAAMGRIIATAPITSCESSSCWIAIRMIVTSAACRLAIIVTAVQSGSKFTRLWLFPRQLEESQLCMYRSNIFLGLFISKFGILNATMQTDRIYIINSVSIGILICGLSVIYFTFYIL